MSAQKAIAVVDLGFGDAGKGTMVDTLVAAHGASLVARFNGGAQAGHNVVTPDGRHHTFSQFGSGTFIPGVRTFLSRFMAIHPLALFAEEAHLQDQGVRDAFARLLVDERSLVTTPYHQATNRLRELLRGAGRHGSCGVGHGETILDSLERPETAITAGELTNRAVLRRNLMLLRDAKRALFEPRRKEIEAIPGGRRELALLDEVENVERVIAAFGDAAEVMQVVPADQVPDLLNVETLILEGAQGVLLDEWYGFHPHTTWSTTHFQNAVSLLDEAEFSGELERMGVLRTLAVRHGAGPFPTEDRQLFEAVSEAHNTHNNWQGDFRIGWFDGVMTRYAVAICGGMDSLAVTHADWLDALDEWRLCRAYQPTGPVPAGAPLSEEDGLIRSLNRLPAPDLTRQALLTRSVERAGPIYQTLAPADALGAISDAVGVRVSWVSTGPARVHKQVVPAAGVNGAWAVPASAATSC